MSLLLSWMYFVPAGAIVFIFMLVLLYQLVIKKWIVKRRKKKSESAELEEPEAPPPPPPADLDKGLIKRAFKMARTDLRRLSVRGNRYDIPWYIMTGRQGAGKSTLLASLSDTPSVSPKLARVGRKAGLEWAFLDGGVLLDINGWYLTEPGDGGSKKTGWGRIMRRLAKVRKLRPLDGVVLTIPAPDLVARGPSAAAERLAWTQQVQERLQALQRRLGVRTPVYVVVTRCNEFKGFPEFVREVPDNFRDDMLGWSNPYSLDATFREDWMDEAYRALSGAMAETQLALMAQQGSEMSDREAFYLVRSQLEGTRDPLTAMIAPLFKSTVYLESFFLRGIYFVGDDGSSGRAADDLATEDEAGPQVAFARKLFSTKIFPEAGLLRLGTRAVARRLRFKRIIQGLVILTCGIIATGIVLAGQNLRSATESLRPVLTAMSGNRSTGEDGARRYSRTVTLRLLEDMANLNYGQLESLFLPFSYGSDIDTRIQKAVTIGWERVVFPAYEAELDRRIREQLTEPSSAETRRAPGNEIEQTPAFASLRKRLVALKEIADLVSQYDQFVASEERRLVDANALAEALFGKSLPAGFRRNSEYHEQALRDAAGTAFDTTAYQAEAAKMATALVNSMYDSAFDATILTQALQKVSQVTDDFLKLPMSGEIKRNVIDKASELVTAINDAQTQARRSRLPTLVAETYKPSAELQSAFTDIRTLPFFKPELAERLEEKGQRDFTDARDSLYKNLLAGSDNATSILERRVWLSNFRLNQRVLDLRDALAAVLASDFGRIYPAYTFYRDLGDNSVQWQLDQLQATQRLVDQYRSIVKDDLEVLPSVYRRRLRSMAERLTQAAIGYHLDQAQREKDITGEDEGDGNAEWQEAELANFKLAEPVISDLVIAIRDAGFEQHASALEEFLHRQAGTLLSYAAMALSAARPYEMVQQNFSWWDGETPPATEAFGLSDPIDLRPFVSMQRETVARLARDRASGLMKVLDGKDLVRILGKADEAAQYEEIMGRWDKIIAALKAYKGKQPGNSVDALESLILTDMTKVTLENCFDKSMLRKFAVESGEFFMDRRERIRSRLRSQCMALSAGRAYEEYESIRADMRRVMQDFPFNANTAFDADPAKVKKLLDRLKAFTRAHRKTVAESTAFRADSRRRVKNFLDQIEEVNNFFETTFRLDGDIPSLSFDTTVDFRVNRGLEIGARQVIEWEVAFNRIKANLRTDKATRYRWGLNDRVEVSFRWARDADDEPTERSNPPASRVEGGEIAFTYSGPWSILRLVSAAAARSEMLEGNFDTQPQTLGFEIWTRKKDAPPDEQLHKAWLFVRVELYSPTTKALLPVPTFPMTMPELERAIN